MRRLKIFLIFIIVIILMSFQAIISYSEDTPQTIVIDIINETDHFLFKEPTVISHNGTAYAVYDIDEIIIYSEEIINIPCTYEVKELILLDDYLIVLSDNDYALNIYGIDGSYHGILEVTGIDFTPFTLTYDRTNNILYALEMNKQILAISLDVSNALSIINIMTVIEGYITIATSIEYIPGNLLLYHLIEGKIIKLSLTEELTVNFITGLNIGFWYIRANDEYVFLIEQNKIIRYSIDGEFIDEIIHTGEIKDESISGIGTTYGIRTVSIFNNTLYIADTGYKAIKRFDITLEGLEYKGMTGSFGTSISRLNNPSSIATEDNIIYIADTLNKRVIAYTVDFNNNLIKVPEIIIQSENSYYTSIALDNQCDLYVADTAGRLFYYVERQLISSYTFNDILSLSVTKDNLILVLDGENIYVKSSNSFNKLFSLSSPGRLMSVSPSGNTVYIADDEGISAYSLSGVKLNHTIIYRDYDIDSINDFVVDNKGNIVILTEDQIIRFKRNLNDYSLNQIFDIEGQGFSHMTFSSDGRIFFTNGRSHTVGAIMQSYELISTEESQDFISPDGIISPARIAYVATACTAYKSPDNYEDIETALSGYLLILNEASYNGVHYYYCETENGMAYIKQTDALLLSAGEAPMDYLRALHPSLDIYQYPSLKSPKIATGIGRQTSIQVISNVAEHNGIQSWNWYEVLYDGKIGYVLKTEVIPYSMPEIVSSRYWAKIKSPSLGEKVKVYALMDTHSAVIITLSDGTKVEIGGALSDSQFTLIKYGDIIGYVETANLVESGLTTGQLLSLILASFTFLATAAVIVLSRYLKKVYS